ncbi:MAG: hypothetical protein K5821_15520 [Nitrobacter sp.]|nr:hypothetical protein [Nitrobacter sp.]
MPGVCTAGEFTVNAYCRESTHRFLNERAIGYTEPISSPVVADHAEPGRLLSFATSNGGDSHAQMGVDFLYHTKW